MWRVLCAALSAAGVAGIVDEAGNYRKGADLSILSPPEPTEEDRSAAVDLSKQPVEKLFRLLSFELFREEKRPPERRLSIREFQTLTEQSCQDRLLGIVEASGQISEEIKIYHLNITGTSGLYWLLHEYPEEHSWVWLISVSHERVLRKVGHHLARMTALALDDREGCVTSSFRTVLMNGVVTWRKLHADQMALLWNGVAFGILGDVTSWREVDEESGETADAPGGPPPNVSWSENIIFGNMWVSSVQKWLEIHAEEVREAVYTDFARVQAGMPLDAEPDRWTKGGDGVVSTFEYLRRQLFNGWTVDKGLLRGFLRHCLQPRYGLEAPVSVADFGAGGGKYSQWLNETGLARAHAFDAVRSVGEITGGTVQEVDFAAGTAKLWRTFDWVLCLDVGGAAGGLPGLLRTIRGHATAGFLLSRSVSAAGDMPEANFVAQVEQETGFWHDRPTTELLRDGCEQDALAATALVFRVPP